MVTNLFVYAVLKWNKTLRHKDTKTVVMYIKTHNEINNEYNNETKNVTSNVNKISQYKSKVNKINKHRKWTTYLYTRM